MLTQRLDPRMAGLPPGRRVYAVGDVHGHRDRLVRIHDAVRADLAARPRTGMPQLRSVSSPPFSSHTSASSPSMWLA